MICAGLPMRARRVARASPEASGRIGLIFLWILY